MRRLHTPGILRPRRFRLFPRRCRQSILPGFFLLGHALPLQTVRERDDAVPDKKAGSFFPQTVCPRLWLYSLRADLLPPLQALQIKAASSLLQFLQKTLPWLPAQGRREFLPGKSFPLLQDKSPVSFPLRSPEQVGHNDNVHEQERKDCIFASLHFCFATAGYRYACRPAEIFLKHYCF